MDRAPEPICCILTVSDRCAAGQRSDTAGPRLVDIVQAELAGHVVAHRIVPDERDQIQQALIDWTREARPPDLILTTGGTGLAPRDVTPEATAPILERRHPALLELARLRCFEKTPLTFLTRGEAGTTGRTLIINLPGSKTGASEMLHALVDVLPHAIRTLRGDAEDCGVLSHQAAPGTVAQRQGRT